MARVAPVWTPFWDHRSHARAGSQSDTDAPTSIWCRSFHWWTWAEDSDFRRLLALFEWTETEFLEKTEGSAIRRINYQQWQRNLAVALGNGEPTEPVIRALQERLDSSSEGYRVSEMVREHIAWALQTLERGV